MRLGHRGGKRTCPPVCVELPSHGEGESSGYWETRGRVLHVQESGILCTCYSGNIQALDTLSHFLISDVFWPIASSVSGENEYSHLGIENYCNTGAQIDGEMKSGYKVGTRAERDDS